MTHVRSAVAEVGGGDGGHGQQDEDLARTEGKDVNIQTRSEQEYSCVYLAKVIIGKDLDTSMSPILKEKCRGM